MKTAFNQLTLAVALLVLTLAGCKKDDPAAPTTIVDIASGDARFTTLVAALQKADLVTTLKGTGPFTVFAPTNDAFTKAGITDLSKITKEDLSKVLLDHVLAANVPASAVKSGEATTAGSRKIYLSKNAGGVFINGGIKVTTADLAASNGVIHVIDNVILQPTRSITDIVVANPSFKTLLSLVQQAGLATTLATGAYTVFAPTDAAFTELFKTVNPASLTTKQITDILLYHVVPGRVFSSDLANGDVQTANATGKVTIDLSSGAVVKGKNSGNSKITQTDILATNGVIHVIDKVLVP
ncbi:MAG: fasciclin domain-containing protein [Rudanella sp.]|nr:fasciclin domain-containing protein [Rudanella sp.]